MVKTEHLTKLFVKLIVDENVPYDPWNEDDIVNILYKFGLLLIK